MKLFIPTIGTKLKLNSEWSFLVREEYRNTKFLDAIGWTATMKRKGRSRSQTEPLDHSDLPLELVREYGAPSVDAEAKKDYAGRPLHTFYTINFPMKLPPETVLSVDRIYIRKGVGDFDSVTFLISDCPDKRFAPKKARGFLPGGCRFWVKLDDANGMECDVV